MASSESRAHWDTQFFTKTSDVRADSSSLKSAIVESLEQHQAQFFIIRV